jgi:choline dehydrogenase
MPATFNFETGKVETEPGLTCGVCQLRPKSRGTILISQPDPLAAPAIRPRYLTDHHDKAVLLEGLHFARKVAAQPALATVAAEQLPGAGVASDSELLEFARQTGKTLYHPVGTCKMGHDAYAVVDSELRVHGVQGLRVVDASVMPTLVSGNTNAPTIMIAERASDLILQSARTPELQV